MKKKLRSAMAVLAMLLLLLSQAAAATAVERVQSVGLMNGYTDGLFHASDSVTRAQMAQILYTMKTGSSDASAYTKLTSSFTDISRHWAAGAIKYCAARGYVKGRSTTAFAPDESITGYEAAKMLLAGYLSKDVDKEGLNGAGWMASTSALGDQAGLFKNVSGALSEPITRGDMAQMLCNALDAE